MSKTLRKPGEMGPIGHAGYWMLLGFAATQLFHGIFWKDINPWEVMTAVATISAVIATAMIAYKQQKWIKDESINKGELIARRLQIEIQDQVIYCEHAVKRLDTTLDYEPKIARNEVARGDLDVGDRCEWFDNLLTSDREVIERRMNDVAALAKNYPLEALLHLPGQLAIPTARCAHAAEAVLRRLKSEEALFKKPATTRAELLERLSVHRNHMDMIVAALKKTRERLADVVGPLTDEGNLRPEESA